MNCSEEQADAFVHLGSTRVLATGLSQDATLAINRIDGLVAA